MCCRKSREIILTVLNLIACIAEIKCHTAICFTDLSCRCSVITGSKNREFLRKCIQGIRTVISKIIWISRKTAIVVSQYIIHFRIQALSVIQMKQIIMCVCHHLVSGMFRMERKYSFLFVIYNSHKLCLLLFYCTICHTCYDLFLTNNIEDQNRK